VHFLKERLVLRLFQLEFEKNFPNWTWCNGESLTDAACKIVREAKQQGSENIVTVAVPVCSKSGHKTGELKIGIWSDMVIHMMLAEKEGG
jgi:hypothetical protein